MFTRVIFVGTDGQTRRNTIVLALSRDDPKFRFQRFWNQAIGFPDLDISASSFSPNYVLPAVIVTCSAVFAWRHLPYHCILTIVFAHQTSETHRRL